MSEPTAFPPPPLQADQSDALVADAASEDAAAGNDTLATQPAEPVEAEQPEAQQPEPAGQPEAFPQPVPGFAEPVPEPVVERDAPVADLLQSASNVSSILPPNAQGGAARAHAWFGHVIRVMQTARNDIERYVPEPFLAAAEAEIKAVLRTIL